VWLCIPRLLLPAVRCLLQIGYALLSEIGSLFGRIRIVLSKTEVDYGPVYEPLPSGCLVQNKRTNARIDGTLALMKRHPRASMVDRLIFLEGFDEGERFALDRIGTGAQERALPSDTSID